jgi:hypothetical protein
MRARRQLSRAADLSNDVATKQAEKAGAEAVSADGKTIAARRHADDRRSRGAPSTRLRWSRR